VQIVGGDTSAAAGLLNVTGAAPATMTGYYTIQGNTGPAALKFGSGNITSIGDGPYNSGSVTLDGPNAYMEVGATNSNSALTGLTTLAGGVLNLYDGASLTTTGALTNNGGVLNFNGDSSGGGTLSIGGSLTNSNNGYVYVGNGGISQACTLNIQGTLNNTGGTIYVAGGGAGANALLNVSGAAPATLTGNYYIGSTSAGSSAVEFGSGSITSIGDGVSNPGSVALEGPNAYMEVGATNSESALTGLTTIASNGSLYLYGGASLTTPSALTNNGTLSVDNGDGGGSSFTSKGALTNNGTVQVGSEDLTSTGTLNTTAAVVNGSAGQISVYGGNTAGGNGVWNVTGPTIANSGTISLSGSVADATLEIGANVAISGTGAIKLSDFATNLITGSSPSFTLTNGSTIEGSGTISNLGIVNSGTISANQFTPLLILPSSLQLNNEGILSVAAGDIMQIGTSAGGALANFSGTTLTGGTYTVGGTMQFGASGDGIVTDAASISLSGAGAQMINFGGQNLLTNLATIARGGSFNLGASWGTFTTAGNFTNDGTLSVGPGDKFIVDLSDSLTNFSSAKDTLTGGTYKVTGTLEFNGADIVTNAAAITLNGATAEIVNQNSANAMLGFIRNASVGKFALSGGASLTTTGSFTNAGTVNVATGSTFTVGGSSSNYTQTAGTTTVEALWQAVPRPGWIWLEGYCTAPARWITP
jgi:hypothetical protein